jgi:hypothetical protein
LAPRRETTVEKSDGKTLAGEMGEKAAVSLASRPKASVWRCREVSALPIGSCRAGAGIGVPTHLLDSLPRRQDFRAAGVDAFSAPSPKTRRPRFERHFGAPAEMLLLHSSAILPPNGFILREELDAIFLQHAEEGVHGSTLVCSFGTSAMILVVRPPSIMCI